MKRYLYIIIGIIVAAAIAIVVLLLIKNNSAGSAPGATGTTTTGSLPAAGAQGTNGSGTQNNVGTLGLTPTAGSSTAGTAGAGGQMTVQNFGVLSSDPVIDYFVDAQNNITAIQPTGEIVTISNGESAILNSSTIDDIISAGFSYDGKKIVVSYGDPSAPHTEIFDVATNAWTPLQQTIFSPQWSPSNNYQLAYLSIPSAGRLTLATVNAANLKAGASSLLTLNANDLDLQWPTAGEFILSDKPTYQSAGSVWAFNSVAGTLSSLVYELPGAEEIWSHNAAIPYGLIFFNSAAGQGKTTLQLQAPSGNLPTQPLAFATLPSKCGFDTELMPVATSTATSTTTGASSSTTAPSSTAKKVAVGAKAAPTSTPYLALYCGVPRSSSGFSSAHLPDDYNMMALFTSDDIYKVNTATGAEQVLWSDATQNMDVSDVKFFNNALFFVNRYDQKLYGLTFSN